MKVAKWSAFIFLGLMLCVLYPDSGFASRVFTVDELKGKIMEGRVTEMYISDIGIEGIYEDQGIESPFMVFNKSKEITDDLIKLAKKYGVKQGFKHVEEVPATAGIPAALFFQMAVTIIYVGILVGVLISLLLINKKLKQIILFLMKDKNKSNE